MNDNFNAKEDLVDLSSAEDFLNYFEITFDPSVVQVNRLHIMQRFHDYLSKESSEKAELYTTYKSLLEKSYNDFVSSNAQAEKVFEVFKKQENKLTLVNIDISGD